MDQAAKPNFPKYSSFKPKPPAKEPSPKPDPETHHRRRDREEDHEQDHRSARSHHTRHSRTHRDDRDRRQRGRDHRERNHDEKRDQRRNRDKHERERESKSRRRHDGEDRRDERAIAEPRPKPQAVSEDVLYVSDRKGDLANLQYGRLHQYSIPAYRRAGFGSVLGLPSFAKIDRFASDDRTIVVDLRRRHGGSERQFLSKRLLGKEAPTLRVIKPSDANATFEFDPDQDFIPVRSLKRKRDSESPEPDTDKIDYRSIEGKAKPSTQPEDSDLEYASDDADTGIRQDFFSETKERNAMLTRQVQDAPKHLQVWLDLVEHQEAMLRMGSSDVHRQLKASEQHALASLRFDIYQRALKAMQSECLVVGLMEESAKIHLRDEHFRRWKDVLERNPESTTLWIRYLDTLQTNLSEFHFENCRSKFLECLGILSTSNALESQKLRIYIFLRLTSLMRHAGYQERAIALWQALLEFQLFRPSHDDTTSSAVMLQDFEEFWESECPRIGEPGATGWANSKQNGAYADPPEPAAEDDEDVDISMQRLFETFSQKENHRLRILAWPGRTSDEIGEDDPFHVVLFADIKAELNLLKETLPPVLLVEAYLCFWGMPPLPSNSQTRSWWLDPFLRGERLHTIPPQRALIRETTNDHEADIHYEIDSWTPPAANFEVCTEDLFSEGFFSGTRSEEQKLWLSRTLRILASTIADDTVAEYFLAFEWHCNPAGAAKAAKTLIKKRSSSLPLYNAYALIENRSGKSTEASRVFSMALGMSSQLPPTARKFSILLWRTWIWEAFRADDIRSARHRISSIGESKPLPEAPTDRDDAFHPATLLKVRNTLIEGRDHSLSTGDNILAVYYAECLSLFAYLQSKDDIESTLDPLRHVSQLLQTRGLLPSAANEIAHQAQCQLLSYHAKRIKLFRPVVTRTVILESIKFFPNNTKFLVMYAANEARFRVNDRVRSIMQDVVLQKGEQSIVGWLFSVYSELKRGENLGGTSHAVRAAFDKATESERYVRNQPQLSPHMD